VQVRLAALTALKTITTRSDMRVMHVVLEHMAEVLQHVAAWCSVLQRVAACRILSQYVAAYCSVL